MKIQASSDLLIGQWRDAPKMCGMVQYAIDIVQEDVGDPLGRLKSMLDVDQAEGVWLDFLGERVGITRPLVEDSTLSRRWGFRGGDAWSFDQAPFRGQLEAERFPLSDIIFRRFVKARGLLVSSRGEFAAFERAVKFIDRDARVEDNRNMSVTIRTENREDLELADEVGALPRAAGVAIDWQPSPTFGFEGQGEPFDQARYD